MGDEMTGFTRTGGRSGAPIAVVIALALTLAGCSAPDPSQTAAPVPTSTAGNVPQDEDESAPPAPVWDAAGQAKAASIASAAVAAFVDHTASRSTWIAKLRTYLSFNAAQAYATVDPAKVAGTRVTGSARITDSSSPYLATVSVPTDAGDYAVLIQHTDAAAPMLVERITLGATP